MDFRIGGIFELLRDHRARCRGHDFLRLGDGAFHALGAFGQDDLRAKSASILRRSIDMVSGITKMSL